MSFTRNPVKPVIHQTLPQASRNKTSVGNGFLCHDPSLSGILLMQLPKRRDPGCQKVSICIHKHLKKRWTPKRAPKCSKSSVSKNREKPNITRRKITIVNHLKQTYPAAYRSGCVCFFHEISTILLNRNIFLHSKRLHPLA